MDYQFSFTAVSANWQLLGQGLLLTVLFTVIGSAAGLVVGTVGAVSKNWRIPVLSQLYSIYVECIRNTPFLVQLYFIFFGLPALGIKLNGLEASVLAMIINLGAYSTEIIRAGLQAIPRGQLEAADALAMSRWQCLRYVILQPAFRTVWPALCSQIIIVMLGSSVCSQVAAQELTYAANLIQARTFRAFEVYFISTVLYLLLAVVVRKVLFMFGKRCFNRGRA